MWICTVITNALLEIWLWNMISYTSPGAKFTKFKAQKLCTKLCTQISVPGKTETAQWLLPNAFTAR